MASLSIFALFCQLYSVSFAIFWANSLAKWSLIKAKSHIHTSGHAWSRAKFIIFYHLAYSCYSTVSPYPFIDPSDLLFEVAFKPSSTPVRASKAEPVQRLRQKFEARIYFLRYDINSLPLDQAPHNHQKRRQNRFIALLFG